MSTTLLSLMTHFLLFALILAAAAYFCLLVPPKHPLNTPVIPFWVALIPIFKTVDHDVIFRKYLQQPLVSHGAVKIWFGGQWNVLFHKPEYVNELFKHEDDYQKSGNFKKIPYGVLGTFLGDQIISNTGESWKQYQRVMKPGFQNPFDLRIIVANAERLRDMLTNAQLRVTSGGVSVHEYFQKYTMQNFGQIFMRQDLKVMDPEGEYLQRLQKTVQQSVTNPIIFNFPFIDRLPFGGRKRARHTVVRYKNHVLELATNVTREGHPEQSYLVDRLMLAKESGELTENQVRDNLTISFVAGHENPLLATLSTMYLLAKHPAAQEDLYEEVLASGQESPTVEALQAMPWLAAVVYESLRLIPPISQLITRRAARTMTLGDDKVIPEGTYVGYHSYSTNRDRQAWGSDAEEFRPGRWGTTREEIQKEYRWRRSRAEFISFHGGRRACLGEKYALAQIKVTLFVLVRQFQWHLDPAWREMMSSNTPLYPKGLQLVFKNRRSGIQ